MKILVTSDWHFHPYKAHATAFGSENSRLADISNAFRQAIKIGKDNGCSAMAIAGDLFHVRGQLKPSVVNVVRSCIWEAVDFMDVVIIPGNHDMENYSGGSTAVDFLEDIDRVSVLRSSFSTFSICEGEVKVTGIEYQKETARFIELAKLAREDLRDSDTNIVLIHQGIDNFKATSTIPDCGLNVGELQSIFGTEIPVFAGHYHNHRVFDNVVQIGAPVQHTFNDEGEVRGVTIYDTEKHDLEFFALNYPKFVTANSGDKIDWDKGDFIRVVAKDAKEAAKVKKKFPDAGDLVVILEKKFEVDKERDIVDPGPVGSMVQQYSTSSEKYKKDAPAIISLYNRICS